VFGTNICFNFHLKNSTLNQNVRAHTSEWARTVHTQYLHEHLSPIKTTQPPHLLPPPTTQPPCLQPPLPLFSIHHHTNHKKIKPIHRSRSIHTTTTTTTTFNTTTNYPIKPTNSKQQNRIPKRTSQPNLNTNHKFKSNL